MLSVIAASVPFDSSGKAFNVSASAVKELGYRETSRAALSRVSAEVVPLVRRSRVIYKGLDYFESLSSVVLVTE